MGPRTNHSKWVLHLSLIRFVCIVSKKKKKKKKNVKGSLKRRRGVCYQLYQQPPTFCLSSLSRRVADCRCVKCKPVLKLTASELVPSECLIYQRQRQPGS